MTVSPSRGPLGDRCVGRLLRPVLWLAWAGRDGSFPPIVYVAIVVFVVCFGVNAIFTGPAQDAAKVGRHRQLGATLPGGADPGRVPKAIGSTSAPDRAGGRRVVGGSDADRADGGSAEVALRILRACEIGRFQAMTSSTVERLEGPAARTRGCVRATSW